MHVRSACQELLVIFASAGSDINVLQSKLHLLQHDKGFLQSNVKYLIELGNKVTQHGAEARAAAAAEAEALAAEVGRRKRIIGLREGLAETQSQNEERLERTTELSHYIADIKVRSLT